MSPRFPTEAQARRPSPVALAAVLLGLVASLLVLSPAPAEAVDGPWAARGPAGTETVTVSDGTAAAAQMTYRSVGQGYGDQSWEFTEVADGEGEGETVYVTVPWTWQGYHAFFDVTARLEMIVDGQVTTGDPGGFPGGPASPVLVDAGPASCCTTPSAGFSYGGTTTFAVQSGQEYGFRLTGRNFDSDNTLSGTFTLSTKPYVDPGIGEDNRQWTGATEMGSDQITGRLLEPGETRWFKFPVVPNQNVSVRLTDLPADYDVALYGDIQAAFDRLNSQSDAAIAAGAAGGAGAQSQVPDYPTSVQEVPTADTKGPPGPTFAPRIYAPRIYAPRIYAPRIYAPRIYAPRIYAPRIYAPGSYDPYRAADPGFQAAFSNAQNQSLLAVSAETGRGDERVSARTGNTDGYYYVRVQGHNDRVFSDLESFRVVRTSTGGDDCGTLSTFPELAADDASLLPVDDGTAETVIVTDSRRLGLDEADVPAFLATLDELADATQGLVVDVAASERVRALRAQAAERVRCPYAVNLVAQAVDDVVASYRNGNSRYVVLAGGDEVVPFFRYPDVSGLGQESQFEPPMLPDSAAGVSLAQDQVLGQDAYGSATEVTIAGVTMPVPDLAVGRLVKTPDDIESTIDHFLALTDQTLPRPRSSLVTGYDFLADAATRVHDQFALALGPDAGNAETLIEPSGTPYADSWTGEDLRRALLDQRHDLVFLAGHFSANDTLAADFATTFEAEELAAPEHAGKLTDTLVMSAGCHSGYTIVDGEAGPSTNPYDWTQALAQQHAVLLGGTGYQYGDTEFLEYSERIYLNVARRLRRGSAGDPLPIGEALTAAKRDYLASLQSVTGIDQKAVLQATMYGLPMTAVDVAGREAGPGAADFVDPDDVTEGPGASLGLRTAERRYDTPTDPGQRSATTGPGLPSELTWLNGADGVTVLPGAPVLPKQVEDVSAIGTVLRGVGFRGGSYVDTAGLLPLTGAPGIEGSTAHTTFESPAFWPQRLLSPNYFDALGTRGSGGRTSLIINPAQYRSDEESPGGALALTNTRRAFSDVDVRLFYSSSGGSFEGNQPFQASAPAIGEVQGIVSGRRVDLSARVTGDPSAGVQQVWVTWTDGPGADGRGTWRSVDLAQDPLESTRWTGTLDLPAGVNASRVRFLVQAANGIGAVALDTADGDGYPLVESTADTATVALGFSGPLTPTQAGIVATVTDGSGSPVRDRTVRFTVAQGTTRLVSLAATDTEGRATYVPPLDSDGTPTPLPSGAVTVTAELLPVLGSGSDEVTDADTRDAVVSGAYELEVQSLPLAARAGTAYPSLLRPVALVTEDGHPAEGVSVTFSLPTSGPRATFPGGASTYVGASDSEGRVRPPTMTAETTVGTFELTVSVEGDDPVVVPAAAQYAMTAFAPPVKPTGPTTTKSSATVTLKTTALLADGSRLSDAAAADLVRSGRVEVAWHSTSTRDAGARTDLATYNASAHRFEAALKGTTLGWRPGRSYLVVLRVLPDAPAPPLLDLGAQVALFKVK